MSFNWIDYLELAKALSLNSNIGTPEARCRCIVSRAYYAVYNLSREYCEYKLKMTLRKDAGDHRELCKRLKENGIGDCKKLGQLLFALYQERVWADYQSDFNNEMSDNESLNLKSRLAINNAQEALKRLDRLNR